MHAFLWVLLIGCLQEEEAPGKAGAGDDSGGPYLTFYEDYDGDGFGGEAAEGYEVPAGYVELGGDCDDEDPTVHPEADEICDHVDNNCDGSIDEDVLLALYTDNYGDGYGSAPSGEGCEGLSGQVTNNDDCDDGDDTVYPGAADSCDGLDNNCDGEVDLTLHTGELSEDAATFCDNTCSGSIDGSIDLNFESGDIDFSCVVDVSGHVQANSGGSLTGLDFSALRQVGGDLIISNNPHLGGLDLSSLDQVGGGLTIQHAGALLALDLSSLAEVGESLSVSGLDNLGELDLSSLSLVGDTFAIHNCDALSALDLSSLRQVEWVSVHVNDVLRSVALPELGEIIEKVSLYKNPALEDVNLSALESAGTLSFDSNDALIQLDLSSLQSGGSVVIQKHGSLASVDLSALSSTTGGVYIQNNNALSSIELSSLVETGGDLSIEGNALCDEDLNYLEEVVCGGTFSLDNAGACP